ncbi:hypothetical protein HATV-3_gp48 [Haloarcula tailed virus 3]|uniref:Uncharacterized protein n=1 Tax=Haloarcula tailed virus 3 TaxID=2877990 RepID=A0AAE8Y1W3_9CAUD|nr:hypothetical protein M1M35_gp48 [Haloarcula tailed virus 3]UBF23398.1 hypothetical protein HATV-3_gp48 [Haloarcula tailed virus 3]
MGAIRYDGANKTMTDRKTDNTGEIGLKDIGDIGVPKAEKESWTAVSKRLGESDSAPNQETNE